MNQSEYSQERRVAEVQGDVRQKRGINWAIASLAIIILVMIIGGILFTMLPSSVLDRDNPNPSSSAPVNGR